MIKKWMFCVCEHHISSHPEFGKHPDVTEHCWGQCHSSCTYGNHTWFASYPCNCQKFQLDNLEYIETIAEEKGLI